MKLGKKIVIGVLGVPLGLVLVLVAAGMIMSTCSSMKAKATVKKVEKAIAAVQKARQGGDATAIKAAEAALQKYSPPQTDFKYELIKEGDYAGGIHITEYTGPVTEYSVLVYPAEIEGYPVRWIKGVRPPSKTSTGSYTTTIREEQKVTMKDEYGNTTTGTIKGGEKEVQKNYIRSEYYLNMVVIPEGVTWIGSFGWVRGEMEGSNKINSISLPSTLEEIGYMTFYQCNIQSIDMSQCASLTTIGWGAFESSHLQTIQLPANLKSIGVEAFKDCKELTNLSIPESLTAVTFEESYGEISTSFAGCGKLPIATRQRLRALGYTGEF